MKRKEIDYAYLAGFIDGDGCLLAQLVKRPDYLYKFQIRISINFYQKTSRH
jgi:intein/homing endonuclease